MSSTFTHPELQELLGAYVVDAVNTEERDAIDTHLLTCDNCQREVDELREVTALLGSSPPSETPELWNRINDQLRIGSAPPPLRMPKNAKQANRFARFAVATAAAIVLLGGGFALGTTVNSSGNNSSADELALAHQAATSSNARIVTLSSSTDGAMTAKVVLLPDGRGYLYDSSLPALPNDRTYQLWAIVNDAPISAGVIGASFVAVPFSANGPITAFAITDELVGGVVNSSRNPIVAGKVTT